MILVFHMLICGGKRIELSITHVACDFGCPMIECVHVLIGRLLVPKFPRARFAADLRLPMANVCHMLVRCVCRAEQVRTCMALISWSPVILVVHVLIARGTSPKNSSACFALGPVTIVIHMPRSFVFIPEGSCAGLARVHREEERQRIWQLLNGYYSGRASKVAGISTISISRGHDSRTTKTASCWVNIHYRNQRSRVRMLFLVQQPRHHMPCV